MPVIRSEAKYLEYLASRQILRFAQNDASVSSLRYSASSIYRSDFARNFAFSAAPAKR
jgi:hypothetical protein